MELNDLASKGSTLFDDAVVQPLSQFFIGFTQNEWVVLFSLLGGAIAFGYSVGRTRVYQTTVFQNRGEALVSRVVLKDFGYPDYHLMNHITLQMEDGTTQVDQILVSRFGLFVIETKDYKGWIFGSAHQKNLDSSLVQGQVQVSESYTPEHAARSCRARSTSFLAAWCHQVGCCIYWRRRVQDRDSARRV